MFICSHCIQFGLPNKYFGSMDVTVITVYRNVRVIHVIPVVIVIEL